MSTKMKTLVTATLSALTVSAAALLSPAAHATTITVGVAANFEIPLTKIIAAYNAIHPGDTINYTSASTGVLESAITSGGTVSGPYDLFLAANTAAPGDLVTNYPTYVVGSAFTYATGYLTLWSNTPSVNISAGLPTTFYSLYGPVAIANHITAPYGAAAWTILNNAPYSIPSLPDASVSEYSNIDTTFMAVNAGTNQVGFVAKSQVCTNTGGVETYAGVSHFVYTGSTLVQNGVKIQRTIRGTPENNLLNSFTSFIGSTSGKNIIRGYCYSI